jgi:CBS domain containing-hemolysin-like protein
MEKVEPPEEDTTNSLQKLFSHLREVLTRLCLGSRKAIVQSEDELRKLIDEGEKLGLIEENEHDMLKSILEFGDTIVREVMVPRIEMSSLREDASFDYVMDFVIKDGHSRIPVYSDRIDNIVGVLYVKDLLRLHNMDKSNFKVSDIMRPTFFIPETKRISELLREFQRRKVHLAIAIDEYGGTAGLVTIEDLLEELVGEIEDEYDTGTEKMLTIKENTIIADGRLEVDELEDYYRIPLKSDDYETIGGLIFNLLERVPQQGEQINYKGLRFTVEKVDERRIHRVKIERQEGAVLETFSSSQKNEDA